MMKNLKRFLTISTILIISASGIAAPSAPSSNKPAVAKANILLREIFSASWQWVVVQSNPISNLSFPTLVNAGFFPHSLNSNPWGGAIILQPLNSFSIVQTFTGVPMDDCNDLVKLRNQGGSCANNTYTEIDNLNL